MDQWIVYFSVNLKLISHCKLPWWFLLLGTLGQSTTPLGVPHKYPLLHYRMSYGLFLSWGFMEPSIRSSKFLPSMIHAQAPHWSWNEPPDTASALLASIACLIFSKDPWWCMYSCHSIPSGVCSNCCIQVSCVLCWMLLLVLMPVSAIFSPCSVTEAICRLDQVGGSIVASPVLWNSCVQDHLGYMPWRVYPSFVWCYRAFPCVW